MDAHLKLQAWEVRTALRDLPGTDAIELAQELGATVDEVYEAMAAMHAEDEAARPCARKSKPVRVSIEALKPVNAFTGMKGAR